MLCPFCLRDVAQFERAPDDGGPPRLRCPLPDCAEEGIPILYPQEYAQHPGVPVSIIGLTGHGKTVFIEALLTHLEHNCRWPSFSCQWMDEAGMRLARQRLRSLAMGQLPDATRSVFPRPQVIRLRNIPRLGGSQLLIYDTGGETFQYTDSLRTAGKFIRNSPAVVWLISVADLESAEELTDLLTIYAQAMAEMGAQLKQQTMIVALTKGDLLLDRPGATLPPSARAFLDQDDLDPGKNSWQRLEAVSGELGDWLGQIGYHNAVNLMRGQFRAVRFCVLSAQGAAASDQVLEMNLMPRGVLAPLFWLWRETRPAVWVEVDSKRRLFFSLPEAVAAAPPGATVRLEGYRYRLDKPLKILRPLTLVGAGPDSTTVECPAREFVVGVRAAGHVLVKNLTLEHTGGEAADVVRVMGGAAEFHNCQLRGGVTLLPSAPGDGLLVAGDAAITAVGCALERNQGSGVSARGTGGVELRQCRGTANGWAGFLLNGGRAVVHKCTLTENAQAGVQLGGSGEAHVEETICRKNGRAGIAVNEAVNAQVRNCACEDNGAFGITAQGDARVVAESNTCQRNGKAGVSISDRVEGAVRANRCERNGRSGIEVSNRAAPEVVGNSCRQNAGSGIVYIDFAAGVCGRNVCEANANHGIAVTGQASPQLEENHCDKNELIGVSVAETARPVSRGKRRWFGGSG